MSDNFWNDDRVLEFITWSLNNSPAFQGRYKDLEDFKKSKEKDIPKEIEWEILSLNGTDSYIHSVKRLSDNEVFGISDKVTVDGFNINPVIIEDFYIDGNFLYVNKGRGGWNFKSIQKVKPKEALFTTSDNKPIFFMDGYYSVSDDFSVCFSNAHPNYIGEILEKRTFSTKEAAENYIWQNKPHLTSYNEIKSHFSEYGTYTYQSICAYLQRFFKSKITP